MIEFLILIFILAAGSYILPGLNISVSSGFYVMIDAMPIVLAFFCFVNPNIYRVIHSKLKFVNLYVSIWFVFFIIEIYYSKSLYGEDLKTLGLFKTYWPVTYILLVYPLLYVLDFYEESFLKKLYSLVMIDTLLRAVASVLYTTMGISISSFLTSKMGGARQGFDRVFGSVFQTVAVDLCVAGRLINRKIAGGLCSIFIFVFYIIWVDQSRSKLITLLVMFAVAIYLYFGEKGIWRSTKARNFYVIFCVFAIISFSILGGMELIVQSFSGGTTVNRIYGLDHFNESIKGKELLGMGLLYDDTMYNSTALYDILRNPDPQLGRAAFFEDFGIIGHYYNFGIVGLIVFILLFIRFVHVVRQARGTNVYPILLLLAVHVIADTIMPISIFNTTQMILIPVYIAIFEHYNIKIFEERRLE